MLLKTLPLVAWENGIWMIGVFVLVVLILIGVVYRMMNSSKKS